VKSKTIERGKIKNLREKTKKVSEPGCKKINTLPKGHVYYPFCLPRPVECAEHIPLGSAERIK
jgi:hypothetical protein